MAETKINANQTNITPSDIGALSAANESTATVGQVLTKTATGAEWDDAQGGGISDVTVNGTSVVSGGVAAITCATIDDTSTSSLTATWSASKLNTTIGNIESLLAAI